MSLRSATSTPSNHPTGQGGKLLGASSPTPQKEQWVRRSSRGQPGAVNPPHPGGDACVPHGSKRMEALAREA